MLKNTTEYESFVEYYESHRLTYLSSLAENGRGRRGGKGGLGVSDNDICFEMQKLNQKEELGLSKYHQ